MAEREPIGVIGTGYVGLVTAAGFAEVGSEVWCIDIDQAKIDGLKRGVVPIWEPGLKELLAKHKERMHFSTTLADALEHARLLFVAVGTPPLYSGDADLSAVHAVVDSMPPSDHHALVMKSTVPVGTGRNIRRIFEEQGKSGFRYVSCPEFLKEGSAIDDFLRPDRVVIGDEGDWAGDAVEELEVMAWRPGMPTPEFLPVLGVSRRPADEVVEVRTKMGRRVVCTPDHPFVVSCGGWGGDEEIKLARDLDERDWLPLAIGPGETPTEQDEVKLHALAALELAGLTASDVIARPAARHLAGVFAEQASVLDHPRGAAARSADIRRSGALRYDEAALLEIPLEGATVATAKNGIPLVVDGNE